MSIDSQFSGSPSSAAPAVNPAILSATFASLFPSGVVAAELRAPGDASLLLPAEAQDMSNAVPKRMQEFAAGRLCARRALAEFGVADFPVRVARDRQPLWPGFLVGSITHTAGICAAVVAERARLIALGVDTEAGRGRESRTVADDLRFRGNGVARHVGSRAAGGRRHLDLLGEGGVLQVPIPVWSVNG